MPIKLTAEVEASILTAYHQGTKTEDIQAHLGITRASIYNVLKRNGLKPDRLGKPRQKPPITQKGLKRLADWWEEHKEQEDTVYHWLGVIAYRHLRETKEMKIYIVEGSTGEYSDKYNWLVKAFSDREKADLLCKELQEAADSIQKEFDEINVSIYYMYDEKYRYILDKFPKHKEDPSFAMRYTGTFYSVVECELEQGGEG